MNIVVCVKQVPDTEGPVRINTSTKSIDDRCLDYVVNPYDEIALEEAVYLKEGYGSGQVTVVSMGDSSTEKALRRCLALGADRAVLLCDTAFSGSDSYITGIILARAIGFLDYDLVLCGAHAVDTNAGQVGAVVAELLGVALVSAVAKIEVPASPGKITVQRKLERGDREIVEAELPAVLTVERRQKSRYASLRSILAARKKDMDYYDAAALGLLPEEVGPVGSKTMVLRVSPPKPKARKLFAPPTNLSLAERTRLLMTGGIQEKKGNVLDGDPGEIASQFVDFLKSEKLLHL